MKKLLLISTIAAVSFNVSAKQIIEKWECKAKSKGDVIVTATNPKGKKDGTGKISVSGVTHTAVYRIKGFDRRWNFGKDNNYSFIIIVEDYGLYYDFSYEKEGAVIKPKLVLYCNKK